MLQKITAWTLTLAIVVAVYFEAGVITAIVVLTLWLLAGHLYTVQQRMFALIYMLAMAVQQPEKDGK